MAVYIKNVEMPKENELIYLVISNDGIVECVKSIAGSLDGEEPTTLVEMERAKATYISEPHGRLIDADRLADDLEYDALHYEDDHEMKLNCASWLRSESTPTVIEGSE